MAESVEQKVTKKLKSFVEEYDTLVDDYNTFLVIASGNKSPYLEWENRFNNLSHKLTKIIPYIYRKKVDFDEKRLSSLKDKYTISMHVSGGGEEKSWQRADALAGSCEAYTKAIDDKAFWWESYKTIEVIQSSIDNYKLEITHRLKIFEGKSNNE